MCLEIVDHSRLNTQHSRGGKGGGVTAVNFLCHIVNGVWQFIYICGLLFIYNKDDGESL